MKQAEGELRGRQESTAGGDGLGRLGCKAVGSAAPENGGGVRKTRLREGKAPGSQRAELYVDQRYQTT